MCNTIQETGQASNLNQTWTHDKKKFKWKLSIQIKVACVNKAVETKSIAQ